MLTVKLKYPYTLIPAQEEVKITEINVIRIIDNYENKRIIAETKELGRVILWQEEAYTEFGQ